MSYLHTPELLHRVRYKLVNTGYSWRTPILQCSGSQSVVHGPSDQGSLRPFQDICKSHYFHNNTNILLAIFNVLTPVLMIQNNDGCFSKIQGSSTKLYSSHCILHHYIHLIKLKGSISLKDHKYNEQK